MQRLRGQTRRGFTPSIVGYRTYSQAVRRASSRAPKSATSSSTAEPLQGQQFVRHARTACRSTTLRVTRDVDWSARDRLAYSPRQADSRLAGSDAAVVMRATGRGLTPYRPPERVDRLHHCRPLSRSIFMVPNSTSPRSWRSRPQLIAASHWCCCALKLGQIARADPLILPLGRVRSRLDKAAPGKTGRLVNIPVTRRLRAVLDRIREPRLPCSRTVTEFPWGATPSEGNGCSTTCRKAAHQGQTVPRDLRFGQLSVTRSWPEAECLGGSR